VSLQLLVIAGPDQGRAFLLHAGPDLMLGRSANAYYRPLNDPRVSRNHCQLLRDGDADRYPTAAALLADLDRLAKSHGVTV
jgi:hypothetical protein